MGHGFGEPIRRGRRRRREGREARRRRRRRYGSGLFAELGLLDLVLDLFLLDFPLLIVPPPHRSLILALDAQITAGFAYWFVLVTFLSSKTTGKAS